MITNEYNSITRLQQLSSGISATANQRTTRGYEYMTTTGHFISHSSPTSSSINHRQLGQPNSHTKHAWYNTEQKNQTKTNQSNYTFSSTGICSSGVFFFLLSSSSIVDCWCTAETSHLILPYLTESESLTSGFFLVFSQFHFRGIFQNSNRLNCDQFLHFMF